MVVLFQRIGAGTVGYAISLSIKHHSDEQMMSRYCVGEECASVKNRAKIVMEMRR